MRAPPIVDLRILNLSRSMQWLISHLHEERSHAHHPPGAPRQRQRRNSDIIISHRHRRTGDHHGHHGTLMAQQCPSCLSFPLMFGSAVLRRRRRLIPAIRCRRRWQSARAKVSPSRRPDCASALRALLVPCGAGTQRTGGACRMEAARIGHCRLERRGGTAGNLEPRDGSGRGRAASRPRNRMCRRERAARWPCSR